MAIAFGIYMGKNWASLQEVTERECAKFKRAPRAMMARRELLKSREFFLKFSVRIVSDNLFLAVD